MMKLKYLVGAMAAAGAIMVPLHQAQAEVISTAVIEFTNFKVNGQITDGDARQLGVDDFDSISFESTADADVSLKGATESITNAIDGDSNGIDFPTITPAGTIFAPIGNDLCIGDCAGTLVGATQNDNEMQQIDKPAVDGDSTGDYAWADQYETGSPITGLTDGDDLPVAPQADVANSAYGHLLGSGSGGANSDNGLNTEFTFVSQFDLDYLEFTFDVEAFVYAFMSEGNTGLASASTLYSLDILDGDGNSMDWCAISPLGNSCDFGFVFGNVSDNMAVSRLSGAANASMDSDSGSYVFRSASGLTAGTEYTLTARLEASVEVLQVPEPSILALFGLGLSAMGFGAMRRRSSGRS